MTATYRVVVADHVALDQSACPHALGHPEYIVLRQLARGASGPTPGGEQGARGSGPQAGRPAQLGGQEIHHTLAQVAEGGIGPAHPKRRDCHDCAIHHLWLRAIGERGDLFFFGIARLRGDALARELDEDPAGRSTVEPQLSFVHF